MHIPVPLPPAGFEHSEAAFWLSPDEIGGLQQAVLRRTYTGLAFRFMPDDSGIPLCLRIV